jgi:hypothetical protein
MGLREEAEGEKAGRGGRVWNPIGIHSHLVELRDFLKAGLGRIEGSGYLKGFASPFADPALPFWGAMYGR